jgi:hemerythrin-like domain-containing protein
MTTQTVGLADTRDMLIVHAALLRELRLAPGLVETADERRIPLVADHVQFVLDLLHHHHEGEDRLLWPVLAARLGPGEGETSAMEAQHAAIAALVEKGGRLVERWRAAPASATDALVTTLRELHTAAQEHLRDEETTVLPLVERHVTAAEWHKVGEAAMASLPKPKLPMVTGMIAYGNDPGLVALLLAAAPLPVRLLMPRLGAAAYARYARRIHGTATP